MIFKLLLPIIAGFSIVMQGTLNRSSATTIGLLSAVFINAIVFAILSGAIWLTMRYAGWAEFDSLAARPLVDIKWWQWVPGALGFLIVLCTPLSIQFLGANITFAAIVCSQLVVSLAWDSYTQKSAPALGSLMGVALMLVGLFVLLAAKK